MSPEFRTGAELLAHRKVTMPGKLGEIHFALDQQLSWLHLRWSEFKALFEGELKVRLLNATAPGFFGRLQQLWWQSVFLQLCRMTDRPQSAGRDNLTVCRLPTEIPDRDLDLRGEVESLVRAACEAASFARDWRNRRLAHHDLDWALQPETQPLELATRDHVEKALPALDAVLNKLTLWYESTTTSYQLMSPGAGGAEALLYFLSSGLEAEELRVVERRSWKPPHL